MTDRELMQQALEALEFFWDNGYRNIAMKQKTTMDALRERLAQPEQEPVAWKDRTYGNLHHQDFGNSIPLYTAPPRQWVGLTEEEVIACDPHENCWELFDVVRAAEAKLKEKNT